MHQGGVKLDIGMVFKMEKEVLEQAAPSLEVDRRQCDALGCGTVNGLCFNSTRWVVGAGDLKGLK